MAIACKICVATKGLSGADIDTLPKNEKELIKHIESVHHMPVQREGESKGQAIERFLKEHPEAKDCRECMAAGAPWAQGAGG